MKSLRPKVSIIGAGNVGMRFAYAAMIRGLARQMVIVDIDRRRLEGDVMDLSHGAPYVPPVEIVAGDYCDIEGSDIVVITAGRNQKPGQTRIDLVNQNVELYKQIIPRVMKYSPDSILLVVTNPVDVLAYAAYRLSGKDSSKVMSSGTVLDTARYRYLLSRHCHVDASNVHAYILGEHGDTEFPVWSKAMVGGILFNQYCAFCGEANCHRDGELKSIFDEVRTSAYRIIERKGETSYGIGLALSRITQAILNDENHILPVSTLVKGYLGVSDVYLSLPSVVNRGGVVRVLDIDLDEAEQAAFKRSAEAVKAVIRQAGLYETAKAGV
ncbi:MAG: L-lactate dehydrogenase [Deltaproteobacteria bacterium]